MDNIFKTIQFWLSFLFYVILMPYGFLRFLTRYVEYLVKTDKNVAFVTIFKSFNSHTLTSFLMCLFLSSLLCIVPLLFFRYHKEKFPLYNTMRYYLIRLFIITFIVLFSSLGLNEVQFSFFSAFVGFFALITQQIFKKR